ncbi:Predicted dehydrogenase [Fontibacillus panacisegetis]|uniref:Predicted dehydrogenase n=1 Tax=Fontibacillus panacisegetis TaxID=670482 RepID=A0A1G7M7E8_9BACL|nr:Gfo/Idh/MocA family oxidoreductase [Fontibacillus panacisegetis]SDF57738.1 Predicted dehydrogenase [Fontibacillus panacisegetis]
MSLNIGIIGTGWFSKVHGDNLAVQEGVSVSAICGTSLVKAEGLASRYGAQAFTNVNDMLNEVKLDAVYICVPPMSHGEIESVLIDRGVPFLVEKPLGTDLETPESILRKIEQKPLIHSVGYHFRYKDSSTQLKELLKSQTIGMVLGTWMGDMPQVPWWRQQNGSGGQFIEQTTHIVDLLRYTAGEVQEVYAAYSNRVVHERFEGVSVADVGTVTMKMSSGAVATISNTCILPGGVGEVGLNIYTDAGILNWKPEQLEVTNAGVKSIYSVTNDAYVAETEAFLHALRTGDTSGIHSNYADAIKTQRVTTAALESARTGKPVRI